MNNIEKKLDEKKFLIGSWLIMVLIGIICLIIFFLQNKEHPSNRATLPDGYVLNITDENDEIINTFEFEPCEKKLKIDEYIDTSKINSSKIIKDNGNQILDYNKINYDFIVNTEDIISAEDVNKEIKASIKKLYPNDDPEKLTKAQYAKLSNNEAFDYTSYCTYYIYVLGHHADRLVKENIERDAFFQVMGDYTQIDTNTSEYKDFIYNNLILNIGKDAKYDFVSCYYDDITEDLTEEQLNYLIYQFSDNMYKRQYVSNKIIETENLHPTQEEIDEFIEIERTRLDMTKEEFFQTMMTEEEIKIYLENVKLSEFIEVKIYENKK